MFDELADSGLSEVPLVASPIRRLIRSCSAFPWTSRFASSSKPDLLREAERDITDIGEAGGGMATALGTLPRGVCEDRLRADGRHGPTFEIRPLRLGFGVEKGEPGGRDGEERVREIGDGDDGILLVYSPTCLT